ncbi:MAG: S-adenosylmethionine:tRNA ribosyltransferase-isomerase [Bacteroidales bacterium]
MTITNKTCKQRDLLITDFDYALTEEKIAFAPLENRDASKLLVCNKGQIKSSIFKNIAQDLPAHSLLLFNDTKVVQARIVFQKLNNGARIEVFCLEPHSPADIASAFAQHESCVIKCFVGNNKRWKDEILSFSFQYQGLLTHFYAERLCAIEDAWLVRFSWNNPDLSFAEILEQVGKVPLPPYIHREVNEKDKDRYQTVFALYNGSVAAPTAALHFTPQLMRDLEAQGVKEAYLTLHVGAGTFKPVKTELIGNHSMHAEYILIPKETIKLILASLDNPIIPVGTTSMRSIESLYWFGVQCLQGMQFENIYELGQWDAYETYGDLAISARKALTALLEDMESKGLDRVEGKTSLMIAPGYQFRIATGIITNFHQPKSTLLLLIAALIGDKWKEAYMYALNNEYRFLSYGDSCLFIP